MNDEIKEILDNIKRQNEWEGIEYFKTPLSTEQTNKLLDYITNLQQENESNINRIHELEQEIDSEYIQKEYYKSCCEKADEYITSYEAISTIQGLDKIEQNKTLDERTINVMVERYLQVHHNLLNILRNGSDK